MDSSLSEHLQRVLSAYLDAPTTDNRAALIAAADEYREGWIVSKAAGGGSNRRTSGQHTPTTRYDRKFEVPRIIEDIPVTLALQRRTNVNDDPWWTLSWRTKYSTGGSNRRFYQTTEGSWTIPAQVALEMIEEMQSLGGLDDEYLDQRGPSEVDVQSSKSMTGVQRDKALASFTGPDEDWGPDPFFVACSDPSDRWKKVLIINTSTDTATFRSITTDAAYMPKKVLRPGESWWLDNSMVDANVQQTRAFASALRDYLAARRTKRRTK